MHLLLVGQCRHVDGDWADLAAGDRKPRGIFGKSDGTAEAAGAGLANVAGHTWYLWIVEGADADAVVLANETKGGAYAGQIVGLGGSDRWHQTQRRNDGKHCVLGP